MAERPQFPTTLDGFGYGFNDEGKLRLLDESGQPTDTPFDFSASADRNFNQARYEAIGDVITEHIYTMLEEIGLHRIYVPAGASGDEAAFVFGTRRTFDGAKKLLILVHGSGVVRAGQWSRSLIINHSLDMGTQMPYIERAIALGYDVLVANTNHNQRLVNGEYVPIEGHSTPEQHICTVWEQLIAPVYGSIGGIGVVAHSYGGVVTAQLAKSFGHTFLDKCFGIAFTDSVTGFRTLQDDILQRFVQLATDWKTSSQPLDKSLDSYKGMQIRSAGHMKHEFTSWSSIHAIFPYLERMYQIWVESRPAPRTRTSDGEPAQKQPKNDDSAGPPNPEL